MTSSSDEPPFNERTRVDLGEDLLERTSTITKIAPRTSGAALRPGDLPGDLEDQFQSATILMNEGFVEEAKRILRGIVLADPHHVSARKKLEEIQKIEIAELLRDGPSRSLKRGKQEKAEKHADIDSESVMRQLDRDLKLHVFSEGEAGEALAVMLDLFQGPNGTREMEAFARKLDDELRTSLPRDRMDVGIAFLEMGLFDLAARQFASAGSSPEIGRAALSLEAYSLILAGRPFEAALTLGPVLEDIEIPIGEKTEFLYLMGRAQEKLGKPEEALAWYQQVSELEPDYRDTEDRARFLCANGRS